MRLMRLFIAALCALSLLPSDAHAEACDDIGAAPITCGGFGNDDVGSDIIGLVIGLFDDDYGGQCNAGSYPDNQDVKTFVCLAEAQIFFTLSNRNCDLDLLLLDNDCSENACIAKSTASGGATDGVQFYCTPGHIYYFVLERKDCGAWPWDLFSDCNCYTSDFDYSWRMQCFEYECLDGRDNDFDGDIDCLDADCPVCVEDCANGKDDDFDGLIDCADVADCRTAANCCDSDGDGYFANTALCGGDDCDDSASFVNPGETEKLSDGVDQNCDGIELCLVDADEDGWGIDQETESTSLSCTGPGVAPVQRDQGGVGNPVYDCDDSDPEIYPLRPEIPVNFQDDNCDGEEDCYIDADKDSYGRAELRSFVDFTCTTIGASPNADDCNDEDWQVYPGATEVPLSGKDEDCNGFEICYQDADGDGFGDPNTLVESTWVLCDGPGVSINALDCDDRPGIGAGIYPGATEEVADGVDQNCDTLELCWLDQDDDGFGVDDGRTKRSSQLDCDDVQTSDNQLDCDDQDATIYPGAPDPQGDAIDQDCDGLNDCFVDADGDGFGGPTLTLSAAPGCVGVGVAPLNDDCDDGDITVNPDAFEAVNDGVDSDCDTYELCWKDVDGDGYGRDESTPSLDFTCQAAGVSTRRDDCNDRLPEGTTIYPGAPEIPLNGFDDDCNGFELCYLDADADGFGNKNGTTTEAAALDCGVTGVSTNTLDCNDNDFRIKPNGVERVADGIDQDCNNLETCWTDFDGDTFGNSDGLTTESATLSCVAAGVSRNDDDCDDNDANVNPNAVPPFDNCSGFTKCYLDVDEDGYGRNVIVDSADSRCLAPQVDAQGNTYHTSPTNDDCDDTDPNVNPGEQEGIADNVDADCDGFELCYQDLDGDRYGSPNTQQSSDVTCNASGVSKNDDDCNDNPAADGASIYPNAPEIPADGVDQSCDNKELCYVDRDDDEYGAATTVETADLTCKAGGIVNGRAYTDNDDDCDDLVPTKNPGATEVVANGTDENCDGADECYIDVDLDGYGRLATQPSPYGLSCTGQGVSQRGDDCLDVPPEGASVHPGATEVPGNGIDENCDGLERCYIDFDKDGFGGATTQTSADKLCLVEGLSSETGDCNDSDETINPDAGEIPVDGIDQNCDNLEDCYRDEDRDDYGSTTVVSSTDRTCKADGVADNALDCFDVPPLGGNVYPGAPEIPGNGLDDNCDNMELCFIDGDRDGYGSTGVASTNKLDCLAPGFSNDPTDCDDTLSAINPGATEIPANGIDENCDNLEDCYRDADGDTYGGPNTTTSANFDCDDPGISPYNDDCDDTPSGFTIYPGATEIPGDGIDQDCNDLETCFVDFDQDTYGGTGLQESPQFTCQGIRIAPRGGDCDDMAASINPGVLDTPANGIDEDCDTVDDCYRDNDRDGYGTDQTFPGDDLNCDEPTKRESDKSGDCLDAGFDNGVPAVEIHPGADEVCNGADDDCDAKIDDDDDDVQPLANGNNPWYPDGDGDGWGDLTGDVAACSAPGPGYTQQTGDCEDGNPNIHPGIPELCDPLDRDENCNGLADDDDIDPRTGDLLAQGTQIVHPDRDEDGYGDSDPLENVETCDPDPGYIADNTDCDDANKNRNPGLIEVPYDGIDNDCDASTKDDDLDGDGFNRANDCNDNPNTGYGTNPGATEVADGYDNDCDGRIDEGTLAGDDDGDGFTENGGDCNDADPDIHPGAREVGNSLDDDCDGTVDEGTNRYDDDEDGYTENEGDCNDGDEAVNPGQNEVLGDGIDNDCDGIVDDGAYDPDGDGYTALGGDCNEDDDAIYPGAPEVIDGKDNDCDELIDEGTDAYDDDGDGFSEDGGDCNDDDENVNPDQTEIRNNIDDDCDGRIDEGTLNADDDNDGYAETEGDCDDDDDSVYPGATEVEDGKDNDCDGAVDENIDDADQDGYSEEEGDCDDNNGWANPAGVEVCDDVDNDCDGQVDEDDAGGSICDDNDTPTDDKAEGCGNGCSNTSGGSGGALWLLALGVLGLRRRRDAA